MSAHAKTPWRVDEDGMLREDEDIGYGEGIALATPWREGAWDGNPAAIANAEFIVRAVNAHEDLVEALRRVTATAEAYYRQIHPDWDGQYFDDSDFGVAHAALAKAAQS